MQLPDITFSAAQLNRIFPFYFIMNRNLQIVSYGQSLEKLLTKGIEDHFSDHFVIDRPHIEAIDFDTIRINCDHLTILKFRHNPGQLFRGQFEYLAETDNLLFVGSPWFRDMEAVTESQLSINDFAYHDPLIDLLHVLKAEEIASDDLKKLLITVSKQKKELKTATDEVKDIALFPLQDPDPIFRIKPDGTVLMSNPAADTIIYFEYNGKRYPRADFWQHIVSQMRFSDNQWSFEARFQQQIFSFICKYLPAQSYINIYGRDVTGIKRTETELEQRVKQFKSLSENIPGVIYEYEFRPDGTDGLRYVSPFVQKLFGITPEEFTNYMTFIHPDDRERVILKNEQARLTLAPFYDESRLVLPKIGVRWHAVHSSYSYTSQSGSKVFTGIILDITERRMAEDLLKANEEKYRTIIANMNLGLLEVDNNGIITYANNGFTNISGYSVDELVGHEAAPMFMDQEGMGLIESKAQNRKQGIADAYEVRVRDKHNRERWWLISGAPRYNDKGELVGSIGIHLDITAQKQQEAELRDAKLQAENLARAKEIFLANMSHEIRTPMNAVLGMSNQLAKTDLDDKQRQYLDIVTSASENLLVVINDILDQTKIDAGRLTLENIGFELKELANRVVQVLSLKAKEKGIHLRIDNFDNRISTVLLGDPYRLNQILLNLAGNAIKFTEKGNVNLSFSLEEDDGCYQRVKIAVEDTGVGIEQEYMEHLFDKFSQENESVTRKYGGTGLGMSICKDLVELMGGCIVAKSTKGKGTSISFSIAFKKAGFADLPVRDTVLLDKDFLNRKRILVTDDNKLNRIVVSIIVERYGGKITEASDGEEAIKLLSDHEFDIVLMDIQMPGISGFETTRQIRSMGYTVPILALTAGAFNGEREKCIAAGMDDYITKPFKERDFLETINKWLPVRKH